MTLIPLICLPFPLARFKKLCPHGTSIVVQLVKPPHTATAFWMSASLRAGLKSSRRWPKVLNLYAHLGDPEVISSWLYGPGLVVVSPLRSEQMHGRSSFSSFSPSLPLPSICLCVCLSISFCKLCLSKTKQKPCLFFKLPSSPSRDDFL